MSSVRFTLCFIILFFSQFIINAQQTVTEARDAEKDLNQVIDQLRDIDKATKVQFYSNTSYSVYSEYSNRLNKIQKCIGILEKTEKTFERLSESQQTEKDYYVKLAYVDLTCLSIFSRRSEYLNFLKISFQIKTDSYKENKAKYEELTSTWEEKEIYHMKSARQRIKLIYNYDEKNYDAKMITLILNLYDNKPDELITELTNELTSLQNTKAENKVEDFSIESKSCVLTSWLAYAYFNKGDEVNFAKTLTKVLVYNEPSNNIIWAKECLKKLEAKKTKVTELAIPPIEFPRSNGSADLRKLIFNYDKYGNALSMELETKPSLVYNDPEKLTLINNNAWLALNKLEQEPWDASKKELEASLDKGKILFKNKDNIFVAPDLKNKGYNKPNKERFLNRLTNAMNIHNDFNYSYTGFSALSRSNPKNAFYRISKIRSGLGLYYLNKNAESYTKILEYYKVQGNLLAASKQNEVKDMFARDPLSEIKSDLELLQQQFPDNIYCLLCKAEVAIMTEEPTKALTIIDEVSSKIPDNASLSEGDPFATLETYRAFVLFKLKDISRLTICLEKLRGMDVSPQFINGASARLDFLKKEKAAIEKGYK